MSYALKSDDRLADDSDDAPAAQLNDVARFVVHAHADPSALPRVLELFALRNLVPSTLLSRQDDNGLWIELTVAPLKAQAADHIRLQLAQMFVVHTVEATHQSGAKPRL